MLMQTGKKFSLVAIYLVLAGGLSSCGGLPPSTMNSINLSLGVDVANIRDIKPVQEKEASVYLRGKVIRQVPLVGWWMYQLQDSTGSIWVLTKKNDLQLKDRVLIKGKVHYQSIPIAGKDFGEVYVEEQQQLEQMSVR